MAQVASETPDDTTVIVTLSGEFDLSGATALRDSIRAATGRRRVILDLAEVSWLDSSTLGVIANTYKALNDRGGTLALVRPSPRLWEIFELTGLSDLPSYPTRKAALEADDVL